MPYEPHSHCPEVSVWYPTDKELDRGQSGAIQYAVEFIWYQLGDIEHYLINGPRFNGSWDKSKEDYLALNTYRVQKFELLGKKHPNISLMYLTEFLEEIGITKPEEHPVYRNFYFWCIEDCVPEV